MKKYFDLDADEKRLEWVLLALFVLFAVIIATGVYSQLHGINYDRFLIPAFFLISGTFFTFYGSNGLKKGNLIAKWTPFYLYGLLKFLLSKPGSMKAERAARFSKRILGISGFLIAIICFSFAILVIVKQ
jgi:type IV secretory pathway component VirB8